MIADVRKLTVVSSVDESGKKSRRRRSRRAFSWKAFWQRWMKFCLKSLLLLAWAGVIGYIVRDYLLHPETYIFF